MNSTTALTTSWPPMHRGLPRWLSQTAIFTVNTDSIGQILANVELFNTENRNARFDGPRLAVHDLDVVIALIHHSRQNTNRIASKSQYIDVTVSFGELLDALDWPIHHDSYQKLEESIHRLQKGFFTGAEKNGRRKSGFRGALFGTVTDSKHTDSRKRMINVPISIAVLELFEELVFINWSQRRLLKRSLSRWLQTFVLCAPGESREYALDQLITYSNYSGLRSDFKKALKKACDELVSCGYALSFTITLESLWITRTHGLHLAEPHTNLQLF